MNFFDHQERAHKKTKWLTFLFLVASVLMVLTISTLVAGLAYMSENSQKRGRVVRITGPEDLLTRYGDIMGLAALGTVGVIAFGSLTKTVSLRQGGGKVAKDLGGVLVTPQESDPKRRRLINVVEELAIASGMPVPEVYVLEQEPGINAFAAGFNQGDAAIGVTQGALDQLNRDELQGVIAHEFSHILNGDMRLNMKLMGVLHGILLIGLIGQIILRQGMYANMFRGRRNKEGGGSAMAMMAFGLGIYLIGSIGIFFGHLIKAAVSRQREFLADASAVQFTRNPQGIGNALKKIAGYKKGSALIAPKAEEVSHLLFGSGMKFWFPGLSTHPPMEERIKAIDPSFDPREFQAVSKDTDALPESAMGFAAGTASSKVVADSGKILESVGQPSQEHLTYATALLQSIPQELRTVVESPERVTTFVFALLLGKSPDVLRKQRQSIVNRWGEGSDQAVLDIWPLVQQQDRSRLLALVELALPALKRHPASHAERFLDTVDRLVHADKKVDLFEFALTRVLRTHLSDAYLPDRRHGTLQIKDCEEEIHTTLTLLAIAGNPSREAAEEALGAGLQVVGCEPRGDTDLSDWAPQLDAALLRLDGLAPQAKEHFLRGALAVAIQDGRITVEESDLLRAICETLHLPLPSLAATA